MSEDATLDEFVKSEDTGTGEMEGESLREEGFLTLPHDWEISTVDEIAKEGGLVDGDWIESADMDEDGEIQLVQLAHIGEGQFKGEPDRFITQEFAEEEDCTILSEGDLLISRMQEPILRACILPSFEQDSIMAVDIARLQETKEWNRHFLKYLFNSRPIWKQGIAWASGTTRKRISRKNIEKLRLPTPTLSEQRKIATVLYTVDQAIQKTEEIIDQYERVKTGLSQDLLQKGTRNHRFVETDSRYGQIPENWSLERLVDVTEIVGRTEPPTDVDKYWGGDIPWASPDDIRTLDGPTISKTEQTVTETALEEVSSNLVPPDSVLLTTRATVGLCAVNKVEMTTSRAFKDLIPGDRLDTWYLYYRMSTMEDYLNRLGWGSTFTEVIKPVLENVTIPIPELEEQKEIGEKLRSVDHAITENIRVKNQYQRLKQGLMQDLLSGTARTTNTNIEVPDEIVQHG